MESFMSMMRPPPIPMKQCWNCGREVPEVSKYCMWCSKQLPDAPLRGEIRIYHGAMKFESNIDHIKAKNPEVFEMAILYDPNYRTAVFALNNDYMEANGGDPIRPELDARPSRQRR